MKSLKSLISIVKTIPLISFLSLSCSSPFEPQNHAPEKPSTSGPFYGYVDSLIQIAAFASDPDKDSIAYRFNWGDGAISDWTGYVPSGEPQSQGHRYSVKGLYRIRAEAKDIEGAKSGWSIAREIWIN